MELIEEYLVKVNNFLTKADETERELRAQITKVQNQKMVLIGQQKLLVEIKEKLKESTDEQQ